MNTVSQTSEYENGKDTVAVLSFYLGCTGCPGDFTADLEENMHVNFEPVHIEEGVIGWHWEICRRFKDEQTGEWSITLEAEGKSKSVNEAEEQCLKAYKALKT